MIHVPRLKDSNAAELFRGFRIGTVRSCDFAVLPVQGQGGFRRLKRFSNSKMPVGAKMAKPPTKASTPVIIGIVSILLPVITSTSFMKLASLLLHLPHFLSWLTPALSRS